VVSGERSQVTRAIVTVLLIAAATAVYYQIPVPGRMREVSWGILFSCGVVVLGLLIVIAVTRLLRAGEQARIRVLVLLLTATVLFFSWADESVSMLPDQFVSLSSKTDALYFNVSTLATVGFGDVHPIGQLARAAVTLQIIFNLVFLGTAVSIISGFFRTRARRTVPGGSASGGSASGGSASGGSASGGSASGGPEHAAEP
jgi:voltage-gated potassium channel